MAAHIVDQIFPGQAHHVVDDGTDEVLWSVPAVALTHVAVDGGEALSGGAASLNDGLLGDDYAKATSPVGRLEGGAAAGHPASDGQDVAFNGFGGG